MALQAGYILVDTDIEGENIIEWNAFNGNGSHPIQMLNLIYARFYL